VGLNITADTVKINLKINVLQKLDINYYILLICQYFDADISTGWSKKRIPSFIFGITSVIQHRF